MRTDWTLKEVRAIHQAPLLELIFQAARVHREHHSGSEVQQCQLINIKQGGCPENCKYCAQSAQYQTAVKAKPLMEVAEVVAQARKAKQSGITRICLGAAWRAVRNGPQFDRVLEMVEQITQMGVEVCCTLGMLTAGQADKLKARGLYAYNHNLDTSQEFYQTIITSRKYADRLKTLEHVRQAGVSVCCGGIIGMGETVNDRLKMLLTLANVNPHPESVPINRLLPVEGTPLEHRDQASSWELVRLIAAARILMPKSMVRLAAGRLELTPAEQSLCFLAGANSIFVGDKLLTTPNPEIYSDQELFETLGLTPRPPFKIAKQLDESFLSQALATRQQDGNLRELRSEEDLIDLTSNDYLGFARSSELAQSIEARFQEFVSEGGIRPWVGATGSRLLTGNHTYVEELEQRIARFHRAEAALLYNSGYLANLGILSCIAGEGDTLLFDAQVHASTWDGAKLSRARQKIFRHNDLDHLKHQLKRLSGDRTFVCIESLYSLQGDLAPVAEILELCEAHGAYLIVDEAHATGILGPDGRGAVAQLGAEERVFARVHTFGKALGAHGAVVLGSQTLRDYLINFSRPLIYTTAFPLHSLVAIDCVYDRLHASNEEREQLFKLIRYFSLRIEESMLPIQTTATPIQSIPLHGNQQAKQLSNKLRLAGLDVRAILSPTVRQGQEQLRLCLHSFNTEADIDRLLEQLALEQEEVFIA